jgi:hypothetical protein
MDTRAVHDSGTQLAVEQIAYVHRSGVNAESMVLKDIVDAGTTVQDPVE